MKYLKTLLLTGAAALLATAAEAQVRRQPPAQIRMPPQQVQRAVPRQTMPRVANPNQWRRFESGVRRNQFFSFNIQYGTYPGINGMVPYYNGIPFYGFGDVMYPLCFGPRPMTRWEIINQQWLNISRFGPTIGELRTMRYNMAMGGSYGYPPQEQPTSPVNEDLMRQNEELREQLRQHELEDAERRGYERGRTESQLVQQPEEPCCEQELTQTDKIKLPIEYSDGVAKVQYAGVAKEFYNHGLFESLRKITDGNVNLTAYIEGMYKLVVRDGNNGYNNLLHIDMSGYDECLNADTLHDKFTSIIIDGLEIDPAKVHAARVGVDINKPEPPYSACVPK